MSVEYKHRYIVTGGAGFIGGHFVNFLSKDPENDICVVDKMGYASNPFNIVKSSNVSIIKDDLVNIPPYKDEYTEVDCIFHFAAESHVDNSIKDSRVFVQSNVLGTQSVLDMIQIGGAKGMVHVSTDEVYGTLNEIGSFSEYDKLNPRSPYAASKAASDLLVLAHRTTFNTRAIVTRCCNNYGPHQHVEKFIPKTITNILAGKKVPVYGNGLNVREWIYVEDHVDAIWQLWSTRAALPIYNIGSGVEKTNLEIIDNICEIMGKSPKDVIEFVPDRLAHDFRYSVNTTRLREQLGWKPKHENFQENLRKTIDWYKKS